jgi:hypothetical protein
MNCGAGVPLSGNCSSGPCTCTFDIKANTTVVAYIYDNE